MSRLAVVVCLLLAPATLAACGDDDTSADGSQPVTVTETAPAAPAAPAAAPQEGQTDNGLVEMVSMADYATTVRQLRAAIEEQGLMVIADVDHAANAEKAGLELEPTQVLIAGNPKAGTPLMQAAPTVGIDLPQKFLVYERGGTVTVVHNGADYLAERHGITGQDKVLAMVTKALTTITEAATREG